MNRVPRLAVVETASVPCNAFMNLFSLSLGVIQWDQHDLRRKNKSKGRCPCC